MFVFDASNLLRLSVSSRSVLLLVVLPVVLLAFLCIRWDGRPHNQEVKFPDAFAAPHIQYVDYFHNGLSHFSCRTFNVLLLQ